MTVTLYHTISDNNVFSKQLETVVTYSNAVARDSMDVINPVITIAANSIDNVNYVYIAENNRYYFVKNISKVRTGFFALSLHVDVLMSFHDDIAMNSAIVKRSNGLWDAYLQDPKAKEEQFTRRACYLLKYNNAALVFSYTDAQPVSMLITAG